MRKKPQNVYVQKITFNGKEIKNHQLIHNQLIKGGNLTFYMAAKPKS